VCVFDRLVTYGEQMLVDDITTNKTLARHGADDIEKKCCTSSPLKILTHCNTGSLATAGYGTALGQSLLLSLPLWFRTDLKTSKIFPSSQFFV